MFHDTNDDDPYMTVKELEDEEDEDFPARASTRPVVGSTVFSPKSTQRVSQILLTVEKWTIVSPCFPDDFTMRATDLVLLAARTDDDVSHLEVGRSGPCLLRHGVPIPSRYEGSYCVE
jgi:hypothetical protein